MIYSTKQRLLAGGIMATVAVVGFGTFTYASQYQRTGGSGTSSMTCTVLSSDMYYGWTGNTASDIHNLQAFFIADGYMNGSPTGTFDDATLAALQSFQANEGVGQTSYVDPATRARIQQISCSGNNGNGNGNGNGNTTTVLAITGIDASPQVNVGQTGSWTVHTSLVSGSQNVGQLHYSVVWGDEVQYARGFSRTAQSNQSGSSVQNAGSFTHVYTQNGTFNPSFTVTDDYGHTAHVSVTVVVSGSSSTYCPTGYTYQNGSCFPTNTNTGYCANGYTYQNGYCVQTNTNTNTSAYCASNAGHYDRNCGINSNYNPSGNTGSTTYCPTGYTYQNGNCYQTNTNTNNGGYGSNTNCSRGYVYQNGYCVQTNTNTGTTNSDYCSSSAGFYDISCALGLYGNTNTNTVTRGSQGGAPRVTSNTNSTYNMYSSNTYGGYTLPTRGTQGGARR